jgi:UDP-glucose 4-epimerase
MKKILITGASGLIGSYLLKKLAVDSEVYAVSHNHTVKYATSNLSIDLSKPWSVDTLPHDIDTIIHLAQSNHYREFPEKSEDIFEVNVASTVRLLNFARDTGVKKFILASSGGVYGTGPHLFSEDEKIIAKGELGFYIGTRLCSELLSESYQNLFDIVCLRFFFAYGPTQKKHMLIPRLVDSITNGIPIKLQGENGISINPIYVEDAVKAVMSAMSIDGSHKINVAGSEVLTLRQIAEVIAKQTGHNPIFDVLPPVAHADLLGDITLMKKLLHTPNVSFEQGLNLYLSSLVKG